MQTMTVDMLTKEETRKQVQALIDLGGTATTKELMTILEEPNAKVVSGRFAGIERMFPGAIIYDRSKGYTWTGLTSVREEQLPKPVSQRKHEIPDLTLKQVRKLIELGGTATCGELADALGSNDRKGIRNRFISLNSVYPKAVTFDPKTGYTWTGTASDILVGVEEVKPEKIYVRNSSGYSDPTMAAAIRNVEGINSKAKAGDIWEYERGYYSSKEPAPSEEFILVLNTGVKGFAPSMVLKPADQWYDPSHDVPITLKGKMYYVDTRRIGAKAERGMKRRVDVLSLAMMNDIRKMASGVLGFGCVIEKRVEIPVEKIVEKTVEVPVEVEKIVEKTVEVPVALEPGMTTISEVELAVLREKARIWEEAFKAMCERAS